MQRLSLTELADRASSAVSGAAGSVASAAASALPTGLVDALTGARQSADTAQAGAERAGDQHAAQAAGDLDRAPQELDGRLQAGGQSTTAAVNTHAAAAEQQSAGVAAGADGVRQQGAQAAASLASLTPAAAELVSPATAVVAPGVVAQQDQRINQVAGEVGRARPAAASAASGSPAAGSGPAPTPAGSTPAGSTSAGPTSAGPSPAGGPTAPGAPTTTGAPGVVPRGHVGGGQFDRTGLIDDDDPLIREAGAQLIRDAHGEPGERAALLVGLLADGDDAVMLTAAHALQALSSEPIAADAIAALARHRHPEARRIAGELLSRNASGESAEGRPGEQCRSNMTGAGSVGPAGHEGAARRPPGTEPERRLPCAEPESGQR